MVYYVIEFQTNGNAGSAIPTAYLDRDDAEAAYHTLLAVAAKSEVRKHGAMLCNEDLFVIKKEVYVHYTEPEPNAE